MYSTLAAGYLNNIYLIMDNSWVQFITKTYEDIYVSFIIFLYEGNILTTRVKQFLLGTQDLHKNLLICK